MKKILVVSKHPVEKIFSSPSKNEIIFISPEEALMAFVSNAPDAVFVFAEYETDSFKEARNVLKDIKNSAVEGVKIFRLGFLPPQDNPGEKYLRLPLSLDDDFLDSILRD